MTRDEMSQDEAGRDETGQDEAREQADVDGGKETTASRGPQAGARLKAARQASNISLDEIARELHLEADKLRALEGNRFEVFSAPVFTKGYLRRYAGLVGVSEDEVLAGFEELSDAAGPPPVVIKSPRPRPRFVPSLQAVLLVLLASLLGLLGWWAFSGAVLKPVPEIAGDGAGEPVLPAPRGSRARRRRHRGGSRAPVAGRSHARRGGRRQRRRHGAATTDETPAPVARAADAVGADPRAAAVRCRGTRPDAELH